ncbi:MAG: hypothetical protein ACRDF9_06820 [Candidatus Limnocylindria bacterium]
MRLPFSRSRPSRVVSRLITKGRVASVPPPPPQPRELIDVVGVGATETVGGVALTLLSLERYREGHIALFRLFRARGLFELEFPSPHLDLAVTPEAGVPYRFWVMSGGGGGGMREVEHRLSYAIVPAPPSDAGDLVIEVREIAWEKYDQGTYKVVSVDTGPWRFSIRR